MKTSAIKALLAVSLSLVVIGQPLQAVAGNNPFYKQLDPKQKATLAKAQPFYSELDKNQKQRLKQNRPFYESLKQETRKKDLSKIPLSQQLG